LNSVDPLAGNRRDFRAKFGRSYHRVMLLEAELREDVCQQSIASSRRNRRQVSETRNRHLLGKGGNLLTPLGRDTDYGVLDTDTKSFLLPGSERGFSPAIMICQTPTFTCLRAGSLPNPMSNPSSLKT